MALKSYPKQQHLLRSRSVRDRFGVFVFLATVLSAQWLSAQTNLWPTYTLRAETNWQLNPPEGERFDASALFLRSNGDLLTVNDRHAGIFRIQFLPKTNAIDLALIPDCFAAKQLEPFAAEKFDRYDCEGLCEDAKGRFYICEEANRWILRFDPGTKKVERLEIDWSPVEKYFHPTDRNASFEGIATDGEHLYVANERQDGRIIVVNLNTLEIVDDFSVRPSNTRAKDIHYSDLCWYEGALFAVLRENHVLVKINADAKRIVAEYDYADVERDPEVAYENDTATPSLIEGLAVSDKTFWLCSDNNGRGRRKFPKDTRPTLFKCPRPDAGN